MLLLDTNVVSELRKAKAGRADKNVVAGAAGAAASSMFVSAITVQELEIAVLLAERREPAQGAILRRWLEAQVLPAFAERILPVDTAVARRSATLHVPDPRPVRDSLIAATALVHGMPVATRNVADFAPAGVEVIDPWQPPGEGPVPSPVAPEAPRRPAGLLPARTGCRSRQSISGLLRVS